MANKTPVYILIIWNIIVMLIYGIDKAKAKTGAWRVPEKTLIALALCMGAAGALIGMRVFHHKTRHKLFTVGVPACLVLNILVVWAVSGNSALLR